ncbi:MAG: DapH/DapD/GlmU-related protein [Sulfuricurvum sp.]|nr:DapH/DapD/GlmU-related protein [Sulfuricurvum sp.]
MEFIKFNKRITIHDILNILESMSISFTRSNKSNSKIEGVSNGLLKIDYTLCFIESINEKNLVDNLKNSLILTNTPVNDEYGDYSILHVNDARFAFIKLLEYFNNTELLEKFTTKIEPRAKSISHRANIHTSAIIENDVIIEDDVVVSAGCVIKNGTYIGKGTIIRENCTIGCDGIALYKAKNDDVLRFPHIAGVWIGKNVEIGANCVIVKGTLTNTSIGNDTVIGNLSNIGHGVKIGKKVWMSVGGLIGGNCIIEDYVTIGLSVSLKDNLFIAEESTIGMGSVVTKSLNEKLTVFGNPAKPLRPLKVGPKR